MSTTFLAKSRGFSKPRNAFGTDFGVVVYYAVVAWDHLEEERSIIQPLDTEGRADWAKRVLGVTYPGRVYQTVKKLAGGDVTATQMEPFLQLVLDDLTKLDIAQQYGIESE